MRPHPLLQLRRPLTTLAVVVLLAAVAGSAHATAIVLTFDSLPSAQGWTYATAGIAAPETTAWSVGGGVLAVDTILSTAYDNTQFHDYRQFLQGAVVAATPTAWGRTKSLFR